MEFILTRADFVRALQPSRYKAELLDLRIRVESIYQSCDWLYDAKTNDERKMLVDELKADLDCVLADIRNMVEGAE